MSDQTERPQLKRLVFHNRDSRPLNIVVETTDESAPRTMENVMPQIGDRVWWFNENRRVYDNSQYGPIWREHWCETKITGETRVSWITPHFKINKRKPSHLIAFSQEEIDRHEWVYKNRHFISVKVGSCLDFETLKQIEKLLEKAND